MSQLIFVGFIATNSLLSLILLLLFYSEYDSPFPIFDQLLKALCPQFCCVNGGCKDGCGEANEYMSSDISDMNCPLF